MQTSGKEARFRFPECSLLYAKAMQTRTVGRDDVHIVSAVDSRVQLAFCKVSANRVKGKGKRDIYLLGAVRAARWVRRPRRRGVREKCLPAALRRLPLAVWPRNTCRFALPNVLFRAAGRPVLHCQTAAARKPLAVRNLAAKCLHRRVFRNFFTLPLPARMASRRILINNRCSQK